jgi:hypothetical protein
MRTAVSSVLERTTEARSLVPDLSDAIGQISDEIEESILKDEIIPHCLPSVCDSRGSGLLGESDWHASTEATPEEAGEPTAP